METITLGILLTLVTSSIVMAQNSEGDTPRPPAPLTTEEKLADFELLSDALESTYPYFGVNERVHGLNWLERRSRYRDDIVATDTDTAFLNVIVEAISDLHNDHTDLAPTVMYDYFLPVYKSLSKGSKSYRKYVKELSKTDTTSTKYWSYIYKHISDNKTTGEANATNSEADTEQTDTRNVSAHFMRESDVATVSIKSFSHELIFEDADTIRQLLDSARSYGNLIIDIQGNGGGDDTYWKTNIVSNLIDTPTPWTTLIAFRASEPVRTFGSAG